MLTRLRRHRWLWALALVVLSFKLVAGTICLNDAPVDQHAVPAAAIATVQPVAAADQPFDGTCLLGETGSCHCACAETLPVPVTLAFHVTPVESRFVFHPLADGFSPARVGPLLRPPIA